MNNTSTSIISNINSANAETHATLATSATPNLLAETASILDIIYGDLDRYVIMDHNYKVAAALWCAFSWVIDACEIAPMAYITAPEKRSGKSVLLNVMSKVCANSLPASNVSTGSIFRILDTKPTLMMDECDTFLAQSRSKDIVGIINAGHTRTNAYVVRCSKDGQAVKYNTFGAKALCGIGTFGSDTMRDRSIIIELRRKMLDETVEKLSEFDPKTSVHFNTLTSRLERWSEAAIEMIRGVLPQIPEEIDSDRAKDNWIPLLAIADLAGDRWANVAREAAIYVSNRANSDEDQEGSGVQILSLIRSSFADRGASKLPTFDLLESINSSLEKKLNPLKLSRMLKTFEIAPRTIRLGGRLSATPKGYVLKDFEDAFTRYLPTVQSEDKSSFSMVG